MPAVKSAYFRHCEKPTVSPVEGKVTGTIPSWLNGRLIRNGPGIRIIGNETYVHAFDGLALLHSFNIENGKVTYFNRPLESDTYKINMEAQRIAAASFGPIAFHDPCDKLFSKLKTDFEPIETKADNCSVNVCYHGDQLYTMTETNFIRQIDAKTLETVGDALNISNFVAVNRASAHPHVLENGDVINLGNSFKPGRGLSYAFIRVPPKFNTEETCYTEAEVIAEIPTRHAHSLAYFHSFGLAGDKLIFVEAPLWMDTRKLRERKSGESFVKMMEWNPEEKTRFYVVSMTTGQVHPIVYEAEDLFTLHHVNAYEEDGQIVVDLSTYENGKFVTEDLEKDTFEKSYASNGSGRRYVLPLNVDGKSDTNLVTLKNTTATAHVVKTTDSIVVNVKPHTFYSTFVEFPRVNSNFNGKKYRYFYGTSSTTRPEDIASFPDANMLLKIDLETDTFVSWTEPNVVTPEPIFAPNPNGSEEEDGVVLAPLLHLDNLKKTTLLILDGKSFKEVGRVEFEIEGTVTTTFHGEWASQSDKIHRY